MSHILVPKKKKMSHILLFLKLKLIVRFLFWYKICKIWEKKKIYFNPNGEYNRERERDL
jgi:hypothetical protein